MVGTLTSNDTDEYCGGEYLQDIAESALLELGSQELRDAAHEAAGAHVDQVYPWDGVGDEPEQRVSAYTSASCGSGLSAREAGRTRREPRLARS
jgi:hypothetical protein